MAGCFCFSSVLAAGKIIIQPKIYTGFEHNSNFWKAEDQEVSVNTYSAKPGIVLGLETPKAEVSLDATMDMYWYDDLDTPPPSVRNAGDDDYVGATALFKSNYQISDRLNLGLGDEFYITRDPAWSDSNSNSITRDKYAINYFEPSAYYEISGKFGLLTKYRNTYTDYEKDLEDSNEHRGIFDLYYNLNRSSAAYLDYSVWQRAYDQDSADYTSNFVSLNYQQQLNYFTIKGGAGYHHRSFDDSSMNEMDRFSWKIQLKGQDTETTRKNTRSYLSLDIGQKMNDDGTNNNYYTATYVRFEGAYKFIDKLEGLIKADYQNSDYDTGIRNEDTYRFSAGLAYQVWEYITLGIEGGQENRDSNIAGNDYDDTFVMFTMNFEYDLGSR